MKMFTVEIYPDDEEEGIIIIEQDLRGPLNDHGSYINISVDQAEMVANEILRLAKLAKGEK